MQIMEQEARDAWKHFLATGRPTVIVQDNASIHKSNRVKAWWRLWSRQGLQIFFIAPHSPQQNRIEGEWLHLKCGELRGKSFSEGAELEKAPVGAIENRFGGRGHSVKRYTV